MDRILENLEKNNKVGALAEFSKVAAETDVKILAMSAWVEDAEAVIRLICDDMPRMMKVLRESGYAPQDRDVVLVDATYQPGILCHLTETLAERTSIFFTCSPVQSAKMNA